MFEPCRCSLLVSRNIQYSFVLSQNIKFICTNLNNMVRKEACLACFVAREFVLFFKFKCAYIVLILQFQSPIQLPNYLKRGRMLSLMVLAPCSDVRGSRFHYVICINLRILVSNDNSI